ncbi:MAG: VWA domain-containing protein [Proteobacteria bacterium]|nr:VWA domain-containing protein [Pseudomonadota bacterium]
MPEAVSANVRGFSTDPGSFHVRGRAIGVFLIFAFLILALMGPEGSEKTTRLRRTPMEVTVLFDLSRSMDAADVTPSRLEAARDEVIFLLENSYGDDFGLVYFTDTAVVQSPHTPDVRFIESFLMRVQTGDMPTHGTDLSMALKTALSLFLESESVRADMIPATRHVLLVTDGESHSGELESLLGRYKDEGIIVDVLAVGTENGAELKDARGERLMYEGTPVITRLETSVLEQIASETGGEFCRLGVPEQAAQKILSSWDAHRISHRPRGMMSSLYREQLYALFLVPAYILLLLLFMSPGVAWVFRRLRRRGGSGPARTGAQALAGRQEEVG